MAKKLKLLVVVIGLIGVVFGSSAYADPVSIDDIGNDVYTSETVGEVTTREATGFMKDLSKAGDMSDATETAAKAAEPIKHMVGIAVQVLAYITICGMALRVALDLAYIALPFARGVLGNGYSGTAQTGPANSGAQSGFGGGFGSSGMSSGFGSSFGSGFGSSFGNGGMNNSMSHGQQAQRGTGIQLVSNAALNAIATESSVGQDGRAPNPFKIYAKDMIVVLVLIPILLVLNMTGTLTELGFLVGQVVSNAIQSFGGMI